MATAVPAPLLQPDSLPPRRRGLTERGGKQYTRVEQTAAKENIMGNRDKRGREKKKPKKSASTPAPRPYKPIVDYKPPAPAAPPAPATPPTENKP